VSSPELRPFVRLFFETLAAQARVPGVSFDLTQEWLDASRDLGDGFAAYDDTATRLGIAVVRGLLIDVLSTGDAGPATAALDRYVTLAG